MFNLKNFIVNQMISLKTITDLPGKIVFKNSKLLSMLEKNKQYEFLITKALKVNKDITCVNFLYNKGAIEVIYKKENSSGIIMEKWADIVLNTILDNFDIIKNAIENKEYMNDMVQDIEYQLIDKFNEI